MSAIGDCTVAMFNYAMLNIPIPAHSHSYTVLMLNTFSLAVQTGAYSMGSTLGFTNASASPSMSTLIPISLRSKSVKLVPSLM